jgi:hypothetical protein
MHEPLKPLTRPDRKFYWVRYLHPIIKHYIRLDLGGDVNEAKAICADLSYILATPETWGGRDHRDLDGLHPKAITNFFDRAERYLEIESYQLMHDSILQSIKIVELKLQLVSKQVEWLWDLNPERERLVANGRLDDEMGFDILVDKSDSSPALPNYIYRFAFPDGSILYVPRGHHADDLIAQTSKVFGARNWAMRSVVETNPEKVFLPELLALYGKSDGWFEMPSTAAKFEQRYKLIYRIACRDGSIHFAEGNVAYQRLLSHLRRNRLMPKCAITASFKSKIPTNWMYELKRQHGTSDGGFSIPILEPLPKRIKRTFPCPACGTPNSGVIRNTKTSSERVCRKCMHEFSIKL